MFGIGGKARYVMPLIMALWMACMMSFMFYPMANMEIKGMSFAILSLDEGVDANGTTMNVGDTIVESITASTESDDDEESTIVWTEMGSQEELDEALENGEYYGALIIPADYSEKQLAATQAETQEMLEEAQALLAAQAQAAAAATAGTGLTASGATATDATAATSDTSALAASTSGLSADAATEETETEEAEAEEVEGPVLTMLLDNAKSPMIATQMSTSISAMFQEMGMDVETETIHTGSYSNDDDSSSTSAMGSMASLMLGIMPPFMLSMLAANFICMGFRAKPGASRAERWKSFGREAAYALGLSLLISLLACFMMWAVAGISVPMGSFMPFMWIASFCMMMVFIGLGNIALPLGMFGGMIIMMLGMMTGTLPIECLPSFWQDWVYPWAPHHYISEGVRAILYLDAGAWNAGTGPIVIWGVVGIVLSCLSMFIPRKAKKGLQDQPDSQDMPASTEAAATA